MTISVIIFDFDGVLAESVNVKGDAFVALYEKEEKEIQDKVLSYHQENGGVTRYDKIRYYEESLCGRPVTDRKIEEIAQKFSEIVEQRVIASPWVAGAKDFLSKHYKTTPLFVASATPEQELERIVSARKMTHYFKGVYGTPVKKHQHIKSIIEKSGASSDEVVMIGDAMTDYDAAQKNYTRFIGRRLQSGKTIFPKDTQVIDDLSELEQCLKLF